MLVGDLVYNDNFDCNCNYAIYDETEGKQWADGAKCLFSTLRDGWNKLLDTILDMHIKYITTDKSNDCLVIEASKGGK